jgi:hypothetical protein
MSFNLYQFIDRQLAGQYFVILEDNNMAWGVNHLILQFHKTQKSEAGEAFAYPTVMRRVARKLLYEQAYLTEEFLHLDYIIDMFIMFGKMAAHDPTTRIQRTLAKFAPTIKKIVSYRSSGDPLYLDYLNTRGLDLVSTT